MIISVTPNPAVDQTVWLDRLALGGVNRTRDTQLDPAGKGVNVSRMVHRLGWPTVAFGFAAGETGDLIERCLQDEGVQHHFVSVPGVTRISFTVVESGGRSTSFYGLGPEVGQRARARLDELLRFWMRAARVLVLAGSLPPGMPASAYADYVRQAHAHGIPAILDADGEALRLGLDSGADLVKPNRAEAERLLGRRLGTYAQVVEAAHELVARAGGAGTAIVSLGADGAVCARGGRAWHVRPPKVERCSTVGSGDSMVAGLALCMARGDGLLEGLRLGTAAGAATAGTPGTALGSPAKVEAMLGAVSIEEIGGESPGLGAPGAGA